MKIHEIEAFLKKKNEYFPADIINAIEQERSEAIKAQDEEKANLFWRYAVTFYIQSGYVSMYNMIRRKNYAAAWELLKQTDMQLAILGQNISIGTEMEDPYHLVYIRDILPEYEKLFPYEFFVCRETLVKEQKCNICGEKIRLRGGCNHVPGKIYMGELCMHEVTDFDYLGLKAVRDPFDKYEILQPYQAEDFQYNFGLLDGLMDSLKSPYEYWEVEIAKEKNPEYARIGRNDPCPCGSGKKFKHCCMNDEKKMMFEHYKIKLLNDMDEKVDRPLRMI